MVNELIAKINEEILKLDYKKHSNEWNVANQLIDIIAVSDEKTVEMVIQDLEKSNMSVKDLVNKIISEKLSNPVEVMQKICEFYGITAPVELPPEHWRSNSQTTAQPPKKEQPSLLDFM